MFSDGKYEILYENNPSPTIDDNGEIWCNKVVFTLNGGDVQFDNVDLKYKIHWEKEEEKVSHVSFKMPKDDTKLSDVFLTMPYGLIKKNRTGVGATTLELKSKRNSIIVVPTKSLARDKAKTTQIEGTNKYKALYVGSDIPGFRVPEITDYLQDTEIAIKKFVVVADSLPRLLSYIGKEHYHDYFLMVDEIDSYQYDSSFRSALEDALDYYWKFPKNKRCLVSATMGKFTDERIEQEPITEVQFNEEQRRDINLIHTNSVEITAKKEIERITRDFPNDKILIAYNSVSRGIVVVMKLLSDELQNRCSVLCSIKSKEIVGDKYREIIDNGQLPTQIVFMTCSYFVGVDINERFHLISISNTDVTHTLLSVDKLQQIAGRCRDRQGLLSETVIYKTTDTNDNVNIEETRQAFVNDAEFLCVFYNSFGRLRYLYRQVYQNIGEYTIDDFIKDSKRKYDGLTSPYPVVRDSFGKLVPAYFVIDSMCIQLELKQDIYARQDKLNDVLSPHNNVTFRNDEEIIPQSVEAVREEIDTEMVNHRDAEINSLIEQLRSTPVGQRASKATSLRHNCSRFSSTFLEQFSELCRYIPFEELVAKLRIIDRPSNYKPFKYSSIFYALDDMHPIKTIINSNFVQNEAYTGEEILNKMNILYSYMNREHLTSSPLAVRRLRYFCSLEETRIRISSIERPVRAYKIIDYNVCHFEGEPLHRIHPTKNVNRYFNF